MSVGDIDDLTFPVREGDLIAGKYRVGEMVAMGGMGAIVEAVHEDLQQTVALKLLLRSSRKRNRKELEERFLREARVSARINSEHVVHVYDVGKTEDGTPYMAMELLEGSDLESLIRRGGKQPVRVAVDYILQVLAALVEAHSVGVVHRDLKPANLFLALRPGRSSRLKVLDFGISKLPPGDEQDVSLTSTRTMLGSPGYMSPEQIVSTKDVDERTDIWSTGVILYELLSGKQAYTGQTLGQVFAKIRETDLPSIRTRRPDVSAALDAVLRGCLQRDRDKRHATAIELRDALVPFASARTRTLLLADRDPAAVGNLSDELANEIEQQELELEATEPSSEQHEISRSAETEVDPTSSQGTPLVDAVATSARDANDTTAVEHDAVTSRQDLTAAAPDSVPERISLDTDDTLLSDDARAPADPPASADLTESTEPPADEWMTNDTAAVWNRSMPGSAATTRRALVGMLGLAAVLGLGLWWSSATPERQRMDALAFDAGAAAAVVEPATGDTEGGPSSARSSEPAAPEPSALANGTADLGSAAPAASQTRTPPTPTPPRPAPKPATSSASGAGSSRPHEDLGI